MILILDDKSVISKVQSLIFVLLKAFDWIESSHKSGSFSRKRLIFFHACASFSELPSNLSTMGADLISEIQVDQYSGIYILECVKKNNQISYVRIGIAGLKNV